MEIVLQFVVMGMYWKIICVSNVTKAVLPALQLVKVTASLVMILMQQFPQLVANVSAPLAIYNLIMSVPNVMVIWQLVRHFTLSHAM